MSYILRSDVPTVVIISMMFYSLFWEKTQSDHMFQCSTGMTSPVLVCVFLSVKDSIWQLPAFQRLDRLRGLGCQRVEVSSEAAGDTTKLDIHYIQYIR